MPFSDFEYAGRFLEMRDARLADILVYCERFLAAFAAEGDSSPPSWLVEAVNTWQDQVELPPRLQTRSARFLADNP